VTSDAKTVKEYLDSLPDDRSDAIQAVRKVVLDNLSEGFEEVMQYGMISYVIPLSTYPVTYNKQALGLVSLGSQKNYMALYLMNVYGDPETEKWFKAKYKASGKRLDMGKSCVRFKSLDDLPLDLIGEAISRTSVDEFIKRYEESRNNLKK
jgi:hypothetical protein